MNISRLYSCENGHVDMSVVLQTYDVCFRKELDMEKADALNAEIGILDHTLTQRENEEDDDAEDGDESIEKLR